MKHHGSTATDRISLINFDPASYVFGRCQHFIEVYAAGNGLSPDNLTERVAALLHAASSGQVLGTTHPVPNMPSETSEAHESKRTKMAMGNRSHFSRPRKSRRFSKSGVKGYWAKMSPEERRAEIARRAKVRQQNQKKAA